MKFTHQKQQSQLHIAFLVFVILDLRVQPVLADDDDDVRYVIYNEDLGFDDSLLICQVDRDAIGLAVFRSYADVQAMIDDNSDYSS